MQCNGFGETVAPLGTALTEDHIAMICKSNRNIIFCFDGDTAGQKAAARACGLVMPFIRDNSDVKFAFITGGKDPDEILRKQNGRALMEKIINDATPLVDFLWQIINTNFLTKTPAGRARAEKFLKQELDKIQDKTLKSEYEHEYDNRKFQNWYKWKKDEKSADVAVPEIDTVIKNTLVYIINKFPEISERYGDFLNKFNLDLDTDVKSDLNLDFKQSERYIISLKLQKYIESLEQQKRDLTIQCLTNGSDVGQEIRRIDQEISRMKSKQDLLVND